MTSPPDPDGPARVGFPFATRVGPAAGAPWDYTVVGFLSASMGVSVAARNTVQALRASGRRVGTVAVDPRFLGKPVVERWEGGPTATRHVSLLHLNPLDVAWTERQWAPAVVDSAPCVCVPFWELPLLPRAWVPVLKAMDLVLAPTAFIRGACLAALPAENVVHYPQAVFLPAGVGAARAKWGLADDVTVVVVSFDVGNDIERKNPWAAIDAFQAAFPDERDVRLIIKVRPCPRAGELRAALDTLRRRTGEDRRIRIVEETLGYREVLELYASCDVLLSLHRSEGLGLHLMEAMSLGKVVVATDWSGSKDFLSREDGVPIGCRLVPVAPRHPHYLPEAGRPGQVWAEPDVGEAARELRALRAQPERCARLGNAARVAMEKRRRVMLAGEAFDEAEARLEMPSVAGPPFRDTLGAARRHVVRLGVRARTARLLQQIGLRGRREGKALS